MVRVRLDDASRRNFFGARHLAGGRTAEAVAQLHEAVKLDPSYMEARNNIGAALLAAGKPGEALPHRASGGAFETRRRSGSLQPGQRPHHLNRALVIREGYQEAHNNLAIALGALGRFDEALRHATRAL